MKRTPIEAPKSKDGDIPEMKARVTITLKPGVLDPQGKAIEHALDNLGFSGVEAARAGKVIELDLADGTSDADIDAMRSEEHTSELQSLMRISYAVFCLKKKNRDTSSMK